MISKWFIYWLALWVRVGVGVAMIRIDLGFICQLRIGVGKGIHG